MSSKLMEKCVRIFPKMSLSSNRFLQNITHITHTHYCLFQTHVRHEFIELDKSILS